MKSENPIELKEAINYLYTYSLSSADDEVASFLKESLDANSAILLEIESKRKKNEPVNTEKARLFFGQVV